jgi:hypothetical protein
MTMGDYDPSDYNVDQVNEYLANANDEDEVNRVLEAERQGQARKGILEGPHNPQPIHDEPEDDTDGRVSTAGASFQEAAEAATPDPKGYWGTSPEAERVGRRDKGLSQRNPAVMNQGGQVPDPSPYVDDSEAIAALKADDDA